MPFVRNVLDADFRCMMQPCRKKKYTFQALSLVITPLFPAETCRAVISEALSRPNSVTDFISNHLWALVLVRTSSRQVDSDEDDAARGDQVELDQTPDDTTDSHKTFEQSMEARTESTENLTMSIEWSAHGAVPSPVAASWCQPKNYDYVPTHSPEVERGVLGRRPACPVPINCGSNSTGGSRTSPSTLVRDKRTPVSRPWCAGLPQRGRHVAPAAPPPFTSSVSSLPSGSNTGVGNTTTLAGEKSKISTSMSTFVPRTATAASCGGGEAATEGRAWGVEHNHHRHRTRLVDGQDMVTLLSLDRLRLGSTPGRMKISPDAMWPCFPAPLVVAGEGSADCCSQSSL